jgi:predicted nucleotidyltransferase
MDIIVLSDPIPPTLELPPHVRGYLDAIAQSCTRDGWDVVSIVLFGSAAKGGFARQVSDVDLIVVLPDGISREERARVRDEVSRLEIDHGFKKPAGPRNFLQAFAERAGGGDHSCFVCTRSDMLSGDVARVFDLKAAEALFVDRTVFANVIASSVTVMGEDLKSLVRPPRVRRLDVFKAWFAFTNQVLLCLAAYRLLPDATRYAMGSLKRSLHSCYFCYHLKTTALDDEVAFFQQKLGESQTLKQLLDLRGQYRKSFGFVLRCLPALLRLHLHTALENSFPLKVRR